MLLQKVEKGMEKKKTSKHLITEQKVLMSVM